MGNKRKVALVIVLSVVVSAVAVFAAVGESLRRFNVSNQPPVDAATSKTGLNYFNATTTDTYNFDNSVWMMVFSGENGGGTNYGYGATCVAFYKGSSNSVTITGGGRGHGKGGNYTQVNQNFATNLSGHATTVIAGGGGGGGSNADGQPYANAYFQTSPGQKTLSYTMLDKTVSINTGGAGTTGYVGGDASYTKSEWVKGWELVAQDVWFPDKGFFGDGSLHLSSFSLGWGSWNDLGMASSDPSFGGGGGGGYKAGIGGSGVTIATYINWNKEVGDKADGWWESNKGPYYICLRHIYYRDQSVCNISAELQNSCINQCSGKENSYTLESQGGGGSCSPQCYPLYGNDTVKGPKSATAGAKFYKIKPAESSRPKSVSKAYDGTGISVTDGVTGPYTPN